MLNLQNPELFKLKRKKKVMISGRVRYHKYINSTSYDFMNITVDNLVNKLLK